MGLIKEMTLKEYLKVKFEDFGDKMGKRQKLTIFTQNFWLLMTQEVPKSDLIY